MPPKCSCAKPLKLKKSNDPEGLGLGPPLGAAKWQAVKNEEDDEELKTGPKTPPPKKLTVIKRPDLDGLLTCKGRESCDKFLDPEVGWPTWLTEDEWYSVLFELYVAPTDKETRLTPLKQGRQLRRAARRLRFMENWRILSSNSYKPVILAGCALRLDSGLRCCWCDCQIEPCMCGEGLNTGPARPLPKAGPGITARMLLGKKPTNAQGWKPPSAWHWRGREHTVAIRLQKAAAEGCLCALQRVGFPSCPAPLLDLPCDREQGNNYEIRTMRRQLDDFKESPMERAHREKAEAVGVPMKYANGKEGRSVGTQTALNIFGNLDPGKGKVLLGDSARWTERRRKKKTDGDVKKAVHFDPLVPFGTKEKQPPKCGDPICIN